MFFQTLHLWNNRVQSRRRTNVHQVSPTRSEVLSPWIAPRANLYTREVAPKVYYAFRKTNTKTIAPNNPVENERQKTLLPPGSKMVTSSSGAGNKTHLGAGTPQVRARVKGRCPRIPKSDIWFQKISLTAVLDPTSYNIPWWSLTSRSWIPLDPLNFREWILDLNGSLMELVVSDLWSKEIVDPSGSLAYIRL